MGSESWLSLFRLELDVSGLDDLEWPKDATQEVAMYDDSTIHEIEDHEFIKA